MDSGIDAVVRWFAVIVSALMIAPYALSVFYQRVNEGELAKVLNRLLAARNITRAHKLSQSMSAPVLRATRAAIALVLSGNVLRRDTTDDYRTAGATIDPETVKRRLEKVFVEALDRARRRRWVLRSIAAAGAFAQAFVIFEGAPRRANDAIAVAATTLFIAALTARRDVIDRSAALALFAKIANELYACAMSGSAPPALGDGARFVLVVEQPGVDTHEIPLTETITKIGRGDTSTIVLKSEQVARMHAVIEIQEDVATIIDLGSGTVVNGHSVNKHELSDGDQITIGPCSLTVRASQSPR